MKKYPPTPELDKMKSIQGQSQQIGQFLDWLQGDGGMTIAEYLGTDTEAGDVLYPVQDSIEKILAAYFKIDLKKVERERQAILDYIRQEAA